MAVFGLGIAATTAIFSVVNGVLLRPLPYPNADRIVQFWEVNPSGHDMAAAEPNFDDLQARARSFSLLAKMADYGVVSVSGPRDPVRAQIAVVSRNFFHVLGAQPVAGRLFRPEEQQRGAAPAAIVSYGFSQRAYGGGAAVLGAQLRIDDRSYTVVGVMPATVDLPVGSEIWLPSGLDAPNTSRTAHNWNVVGRLASGVPIDLAQREVSGIMRSLKRRYGDQITAVDGRLVPLREQLVGGTRSTLLILLGASLVLLLIACTNAVNLLVARMASRQGELAVRTALGAGRGRLVQQFLAESLVLALAGGAVGVGLARLGVTAILGLQQGQIPRAGDVSVDGRVLLFAFGVSVAAGAAMALVAAWRGGHRDVRAALSEAQRTLSGGGSSYRVRRTLVAAQIAMTLAMLVSAGLLARSFRRVLSVQPGFVTSHAVVLDLAVPAGDSASLVHRAQLYETLMARLRAIPGVTGAGAVGTMPLAPEAGADGTFLILDRPNEHLEFSQLEKLFTDPSRTGQAEYRVAGPGYFSTMHIPVLRGRAFDERDTYDAPSVAVISQSLAETRWPGRDPIGQVIEYGNMDGDLRP
ncbi:MAG TPA: ABC transporter permease, partial [Gemmatimonadaceae bacterium]